MLVVLDANVLVSDPTLSGLVWRALAHAPADWGVEVVVPRVALVEAQATLARQSSEALGAFQKAIDAARRVGLPLADAAAELLKSASDASGTRLADQLAQLGVEVIDPPDVPHMDLVERAARRRKPCDTNGDGYRDTLIWLTVLELAKGTDGVIALVTANTKDFADNDSKLEDKLHPHLVEELVAIDAAGRVRLYRRLDELVIALAAQHSTTEPSDLKEVGRELERGKIIDYLTSKVAPGLIGRSVKPSGCGLPRYVTAASIRACADLGDVEIVVTAPKGVESLARFTFTAMVEIEAEIPPPEGDDITDGAAPERSTEAITKALKVSGVLTRDSFHRPTSAEVTDVAALPGDPGLAAWRVRRNAAWPLGDPAFPSSLLKTIADAQRLSPLIDPAWLRTQTDLQKVLGDFPKPTAFDAIVQVQKIIGDLPKPSAFDTLANIQKIVGDLQKPLGLAGLGNVQQFIDSIQMGPGMRAIADAQKLIGQASLNPIITSAIEAARRAEAVRRAAEPDEDGGHRSEPDDGDAGDPAADGGAEA